MASQPIDIYGRVSRASDERMRSTAGQVEECRARLDDLGLPVGVVHVDNSRSAWNPRTYRPGWDALMTRLETGAAGGVIVFDLARFSRRPIEGERLILAAERGLRVLDSENSYDLTSANGRKSFRDQMAGAAYESDRLSTRVKRGKRAKALRGEPNVSSRPFGFEADGVTRRPDEAGLLRDWTRRIIAGEPQDRIVAEANERGIPTSYGLTWNRASMRQVLTRPRNAGSNVYGGEIVGQLPGDPIVDEATFARLCAVYTARRNGRPPSTQYLCSAGTAVCGICRRPLAARPRGNMKPYEDGEVRRQYWCVKAVGGCGRIAVDQRGLDEHAGKVAVAILSDVRNAAAIAAATRRAADRAGKIDAEIGELEQLAEELAGRLGRREITLARYDAATKPLDTQIETLRAERAALPDPGAVVVDTARSQRDWQSRWEAAEPAERRTLLRAALRDQVLMVGPADRSARTDVSARVSVGKL